MDIDASQYAEMSREMMVSHDYLHVYDRGTDYLDKPPMLFWLSTLSMKVFGLTNFGYKLPSVLFLFLAVYATYRFARLLYDESTARVAALVLMVCQGSFLMTNDVRTDTILMGFVATALWAIKECELKRRPGFVLLGTAALAGGLMTKGPIALFVPLFAFGTDWLLKRKWKAIFNPWHLLDAALIAVFLIPMCIGLYQQFDLHPEKLIDGKTGTSGIKFFFWTQSFGRITGENRWNNGADPSFLLVNMLWSFLPWIFLFLVALFVNVRELIRQKLWLNEAQEWVSTGGFLLTYAALGMSHYQLPHYIFVAFPLAAVVVAGLLRRFFTEGALPKLRRGLTVTQLIVCALLMTGLALILLFTFPAGGWVWIGWAAGIVVIGITAWQAKRGRLIWASAVTMVVLNIFLTHYFYASLLQYQCGSQAGQRLLREGAQPGQFIVYKNEDPLECLDFYARGRFRRLDSSLAFNGIRYVLTQTKYLPEISAAGRPFEVLQQGPYFKVSELTPEFLNVRTRPAAVKQYSLIRLR